MTPASAQHIRTAAGSTDFKPEYVMLIHCRAARDKFPQTQTPRAAAWKALREREKETQQRCIHAPFSSLSETPSPSLFCLLFQPDPFPPFQRPSLLLSQQGPWGASGQHGPWGVTVKHGPWGTMGKYGPSESTGQHAPWGADWRHGPCGARSTIVLLPVHCHFSTSNLSASLWQHWHWQHGRWDANGKNASAAGQGSRL